MPSSTSQVICTSSAESWSPSAARVYVCVRIYVKGEGQSV